MVWALDGPLIVSQRHTLVLARWLWHGTLVCDTTRWWRHGTLLTTRHAGDDTTRWWRHGTLVTARHARDDTARWWRPGTLVTTWHAGDYTTRWLRHDTLLTTRHADDYKARWRRHDTLVTTWHAGDYSQSWYFLWTVGNKCIVFVSERELRVPLNYISRQPYVALARTPAKTGTTHRHCSGSVLTRHTGSSTSSQFMKVD